MQCHSRDQHHRRVDRCDRRARKPAGSRTGICGRALVVGSPPGVTARRVPRDRHPTDAGRFLLGTTTAASVGTTGDLAASGSVTARHRAHRPRSSAELRHLSAPPGRARAPAPPAHLLRPRHPAALLLPASPPVAVAVPAIGINSSLIDLGRNADGTIEVPSLDDPDSKPGWYPVHPPRAPSARQSSWGTSTPGNSAPACSIRCRICSRATRSTSTRADGTVAQFSVDYRANRPEKRLSRPSRSTATSTIPASG